MSSAAMEMASIFHDKTASDGAIEKEITLDEFQIPEMLLREIQKI